MSISSGQRPKTDRPKLISYGKCQIYKCKPQNLRLRGLRYCLIFFSRSELTLAHQQVQMGHNDHREEIIALQNQSQLIEDENNELKKKVTLYEEEFRKVRVYETL